LLGPELAFAPEPLSLGLFESLESFESFELLPELALSELALSELDEDESDDDPESDVALSDPDAATLEVLEPLRLSVL
jgi:hypothetical protein